MLKNLTKLEVVIENKVYQFICDPTSSTTHCNMALCKFIKHIGNIEDSAMKPDENLNDNEPPEVVD